MNVLVKTSAKAFSCRMGRVFGSGLRTLRRPSVRRTVEPGRGSAPEGALQTLQRTAGNAAVSRLIGQLQRQPNDEQGREHDRGTPDPDDRPNLMRGTELVEDAAKVLPPGTDRTGAGALAAIQAAGLTPAALRLLVTQGHTDRVALSNLAFWAAHPDQFGQKLRPDQPGFPQLSADWIRLRDTAVADALRSPGRSASGAAGTTTSTASGATGTTASGVDRGDAAFVADAMQSTIARLRRSERERFEGITWGWADYPGTEFPIAGMKPEDVARFRSDPALTFDEAGKKFVGKHQNDAKALFLALAGNRPGGGERRVNIGGQAVITKEEFAAADDKDAIDAYVTGQLGTPLPGGQRLNKHAAAAFLTMREAAARDGVPLTVMSGFRGRAAEEAGARKNTNRYAFGGFSPHSLGLAADISLRVGTSARADFSEASTRMDKLVNMLSSPVYKWIYLNGAQFGFFQYRAEPWHWEYNPPGFKTTYWAERP